ncbi:hypothetical protein KGF54_005263 [Candida jiufengensis]|uniref:uncharacterized protein n=1 Tax=Candida jiufengensis TaxID=497108 RepID=UPI002225A882|nr:uncharacterized protein KGF54_005263 [Candida jiufengensis]KAI5950115.1 hypothetical protein KGF54_005263 [Candida jiufengensis]
MSSDSDSTPEFKSIELSHSTPIDHYHQQLEKESKLYHTLDPKFKNNSISSDIEYGRNLTDSPDNSTSIIQTNGTENLDNYFNSKFLEPISTNWEEFISSLDLKNLDDCDDKSEVLSVDNLLELLNNSKAGDITTPVDKNLKLDPIESVVNDQEQIIVNDKHEEITKDKPKSETVSSLDAVSTTQFEFKTNPQLNIKDLESKIKFNQTQIQLINNEIAKINSKILKLKKLSNLSKPSSSKTQLNPKNSPKLSKITKPELSYDFGDEEAETETTKSN